MGAGGGGRGGGRPGRPAGAGGGPAGNARPLPAPSQAGRRPREPRPRDPSGQQRLEQSTQARAGSAARAGSGVPGPLCVKGGGGVRGSPRPQAPPTPAFPREPPSVLRRPPLPSGGRASPPPHSGLLRARPLPTPPAWASVPIGRALPSHPHPPRHFALSPPPPLTSSSSLVGPSAALHSPPGFADFRPPSASQSRAAASGV